MGRKVFVSYKYADSDVENIPGTYPTTVRDYVDVLQDELGKNNVNKGEMDGEDLSDFADSTIKSKLWDKIYDSSLTLVMVSPGMKEAGVAERDQWIPWEVAYSLRESSRRNCNGDSVTSHTNAMIAVVLPDAIGSYDYFLEGKSCCPTGCTLNHVGRLFKILRANMFNLRTPETKTCDRGDEVWYGSCSYIEPVKWADFMVSMDYYFDRAYKRLDNLDDYDICKEV